MKLFRTHKMIISMKKPLRTQKIVIPIKNAKYKKKKKNISDSCSLPIYFRPEITNCIATCLLPLEAFHLIWFVKLSKVGPAGFSLAVFRGCAESLNSFPHNSSIFYKLANCTGMFSTQIPVSYFPKRSHRVVAVGKSATIREKKRKVIFIMKILYLIVMEC